MVLKTIVLAGAVLGGVVAGAAAPAFAMSQPSSDPAPRPPAGSITNERPNNQYNHSTQQAPRGVNRPEGAPSADLGNSPSKFDALVRDAIREGAGTGASGYNDMPLQGE